MSNNYTIKKNVIYRFFIYSKERFPLVPAVLFGFLFSRLGLAYVQQNPSWQLISVLTFVLFLFLLRVRLIDEIKDYKFDSVNYSHRPVQRGVLSTKEIKILLVLVIVLELLIQFYLGLTALTIYMGLFLYHFLMYHNFFLPHLEQKRFFIYILLHQLVFLFYAYYILAVAQLNFHIPISQNLGIFLALFLPAYVYEIGRKCKHRFSDQGTLSNDTYIYRWGKNKAFTFLFFLLSLQILALFLLTKNTGLPIIINALLIIITIILFVKKNNLLLKHIDSWSMFLGIFNLILLNFLI